MVKIGAGSALKNAKTFVLGSKSRRFELPVYLLAASVFMPYRLTGVVLVLMAILFCTIPSWRKQTFSTKAPLYFAPFFVLIVATSAFYWNLLGLACSVGIISIVMCACFTRQVMTRRMYERMLNIFLCLSVSAAVYGVMEKIYYTKIYFDNIHRVSSVFYNANYYGTVSVFCIIVCGYKFFTKSTNRLFYIIVALTNAFSILLSGSMSSLLSLAAGLVVLLLALKKFRMLMMMAAAAGGVLLLTYFFPSLLPARLAEMGSSSDSRMWIWELSVLQITETPLFGRGPMTYDQISVGQLFRTQHAHNLYLDSILSYGFIGTAIVVMCTAKYAANTINNYVDKKSPEVCALIFALLGAIFTHGLTDNTSFWLQTGLLAAMVFAGEGLGRAAASEPAGNLGENALE